MIKSKLFVTGLRAVVLIAILLTIHNRWVVPRISVDQMRQLVALENIAQGNGVTYQFVAEGNDTPFLNNSFPMGYYILMVPVYALFHDAILLHRVLEIVGLLLLIYQLYLFGNWIEEKYNITKAGLWILAFTLIQLNPWRATGFTDVWSLMLLITSIRIILTHNKYSVWQLICIGFLAYAMVSMRYAYYPLALIPVFLIFFKLPFRNVKTYVPLVVLLLLLGGTLVFNRIYFADFDHIESQFHKTRWFFSHLKQMDPVGFNAFFSDHVIFGALGLERWGLNTNWGFKYIILSGSLVMLGILMISSFRTFNLQFRNFFNGENAFPAVIWVTVLLNVGFISAISVYYPSKQNDYLYTWQLISRYFAPAYIFLQILLIFLIFKDKNRFRKVLMLVVFATSIVFQTAYFGSFISRFSMTNTWGNYVQYNGRNEMPEVIVNYKKLLADPGLELSIPESQFSYLYLSIYYLTGPERLTDYLEIHCPTCLDFYSGKQSEE